jgi:hypothetical protein
MVYFDFLFVADSLTVAELLFFFDPITFPICRSSSIRSPLPIGFLQSTRCLLLEERRRQSR